MTNNEKTVSLPHRKKLFYIMGIDWEWIFQRPQIIAQHLEEVYDVTVIFPRSILQQHKKQGQRYPRNYRILWTIPFQEKNFMLGLISSLFSRRLFRDIQDYDVVWIGYPLYYRYIPKEYTGKIIYDCMDNHEALYPDRKRVEKLLCQERALASKCDILLVTGNKLRQKMKHWCGEGRIRLVRNGVAVEKVLSPKLDVRRDKYKIGYFGTIAEWFDYELLEKSLEKMGNIEYHLIGPVMKQSRKVNNNIIFEGIVPHAQLPEATADFDCLLMPFKVNDVVEWVDPVKLYEYISLGKCIIASKYEEIERFEDYVYFYSTSQEYIGLLTELAARGFPPKYTSNQQTEFLDHNFWETRYKEIDSILNNL